MRFRRRAAMATLASVASGLVLACGARTGLFVGGGQGELGDSGIAVDSGSGSDAESDSGPGSDSGPEAVEAGVVTSSSPQDLSIDFVVFTGSSASGDCVADPCTITGTPAITAVHRSAVGQYSLQLAAGAFTAPPACACNAISRIEGSYTYASGAAPTLTAFAFDTPDTAGPADSQGSCICVGPHAPSPPVVTSSSPSEIRVESVTFSGPSVDANCGSDPCTATSTPAITAVHRLGAGEYSVQFADGAFSAPPACVCNTVSQSNGGYTYASGSPPGGSTYVFGTPGPGGLADSQGSCICAGTFGPATKPQVTTSLPTGLRLESVAFAGASMPGDCTSDPCVIAGTPAILTVDRVNTGAYQANFVDGGFSAPPACACSSIARGSGGFTYSSGEPPIVSLYGFNTQGPTGLEDSQGSCICVGDR